MNPESFCTCIYVYNTSDVTVEVTPSAALGARNDVVLIRLDDARTNVPIARSRRLDPGIYRMHTATRPNVQGGGDIETVIVPNKDRPPDPTANERFRRAFPDVDYERLKDFIKEDSREFDLAASASANAGTK